MKSNKNLMKKKKSLTGITVNALSYSSEIESYDMSASYYDYDDYGDSDVLSLSV